MRRLNSRNLAFGRGRVRAYHIWLRLIEWMGYGQMTRRAIADLPHAPGAILDVGTGTGAAARAAAAAHPASQIVALDLSAEFLAEAKRDRDATRIRFIQGSGAALPVRAGTFDLVTSFGVLCHTADAEVVIREMRRVLRRGGHALLWTRGRGPSGQFLRLVFPLTSGGARFFLYSPRELRRLFEAAGFCDVRVTAVAHGLLVSGRVV